MTLISVEVLWERGDAVFTDNRYSRLHTWTFDGGSQIQASSSPHIVPLPMSDASAVDPEEAFVVSLSSRGLYFKLLEPTEFWSVR